MSAWVVDPEHIHVLLHAGLDRKYQYAVNSDLTWYWGNPTQHGKLTPETVDQVGQMLLDANAASVNFRYDENEVYVYDYRKPRFRGWSEVELLKAISCYEHQSCEVDDWKDSQAWAFCQALTGAIIAALPGYAAADTWGIEPTTVPAISRKATTR